MINFQILASLFPEGAALPFDYETLERAILRTLAWHSKGVEEFDISLVISDDQQLAALNQQFLGIDAPTDVLSFPSGEQDPDSESIYLGDIIISYPTAAVQASSRRHSISDELQLLVVHGVLHLLGYDHSSNEEKNRMWKAQAGILADLGYSSILPE